MDQIQLNEKTLDNVEQENPEKYMGNQMKMVAGE
jgi:hypothetical protein